MQLIIAEKPSVAKEIAKCVGATRHEQGYLSGQETLVSWCVGHLVELAPPEDYDPALKRWKLDTLPIIPDRYITTISQNTASQFDILKKLMQRTDVTELVCATDAGREGELIFRLVYEKAGCEKPFKRLWISSMEEKSIRDGLAAMKDGSAYDNLYRAALCRQRADWLIGMNFTRLYSVMYNKVLKAGRVQTPTVNLIVKRQNEIDGFVPQIYYNLTADMGSYKAYSRAEAAHEAQAIIARCGGKDAFVTKAERQEKRENPPALYDLTTLQRDANRLLGYSAQQTLDAMQKLYDTKLATYPRTDSRYITADMAQSARSLMDTLLAAGIYDGDTAALDTGKLSVDRLVNDKKVTDHHAILPTGSVTREKLLGLPEEQRNILLLVAYRLLSAAYVPHCYTATKVMLDINGVPFTATGKEILEPGYRWIDEQMRSAIKSRSAKEDKPDSPDNAVLPMMGVGNIFSVHNVSAEEKKTQPPKAYTEDTLLAAMETAGKHIADEALRDAMKNSGLGTPATRASIIESVIKTGYIVRDGKKLIPTDIAFTFMEIVADMLKEPELTAQWEKELAEISCGERSEADFIGDVTAFINDFISDAKIFYSPEDSKTVFKPQRDLLGVCPRCGQYVVEYPKSYSCESGKGGCGFVIWKTMAGKDITMAMMQQLLSRGKTGLLKGFKSKAGNPFDATLVLKSDFSVGYEFLGSK